MYPGLSWIGNFKDQCQRTESITRCYLHDFDCKEYHSRERSPMMQKGTIMISQSDIGGGNTETNIQRPPWVAVYITRGWLAFFESGQL